MKTKQWQQSAHIASNNFKFVTDNKINSVLNELSEAVLSHVDILLAANQQDLDKMEKSNPLYDRLLLNEERLKGISSDIANVAKLPTPLGRILNERTRPNGMLLKKISAPFGVIGVVYEARPNVSFDVFSLCFKSGNVCLLKGGSDAFHSNKAIVNLIQNILEKNGLDKNIVQLLPPEHEAVAELLNAVGVVDLIIPRGGRGLIDFVRKNSLVPIIETGAGVCHTYFDEYGDLEKGKNIVFNAKTRRVSVCNALDCLIIHKKRLTDLPEICQKLSEKDVKIYADEESFRILTGKYPANLLFHTDNTSYGTEFLDYKMSIKTVNSIQEALQHISENSSKHSEAIITEDEKNTSLFSTAVDAACVYTNVSTAFTDGAQFGLGAEIGISTQKLHARGPMGLEELTTYKWLISGNGQTRE